MTPPINLTEAMIRNASVPQSFERGKEYYHSGAIYNAARLGNFLFADCEGTSAPSYRVQVGLDEAGVHSAACTCPYDWGGYCKHVVALLLTYIHKRELFVERSEPEDLLSPLSREDLVQLMGKLVRRQPDLYEWLEAEIEKPHGKAKHTRTAPVAAQGYRQQINAILHSLDRMRPSQAYWHMEEMVEQLRGMQESAQRFLENGDAQSALTILVTLVEEVSGQYGLLDDSNGTLGGFVEDLGLPLAEAILSAELTEKEREAISNKLEELAAHLSDYGIEATLEVAIAAVVRGWSGGEAGAGGGGQAREGDGGKTEAWVSASLNEAKLNVLERRGEVEAYLALASSTGHYTRCAVKLLDIGRTDEGVAMAMAHLTTAEEALVIAQRLRELGRVQEAIRLGEHGLSLAGEKYELARWLGPLEEGCGYSDKALHAYLVGFAEGPSLSDYSTIQRLAGPTWKELKPKVMEMLRISQDTDALADVLLAEGEWGAAIGVADEKKGWGYSSLVEKVADAVVPHRPDWVIKVCRRQAEELIETRQSKHYGAAAHWLTKMKAAFVSRGQEREWKDYLEELRNKYSRRPALQAELRRL